MPLSDKEADELLRNSRESVKLQRESIQIQRESNEIQRKQLKSIEWLMGREGGTSETPSRTAVDRETRDTLSQILKLLQAGQR